MLINRKKETAGDSIAMERLQLAFGNEKKHQLSLSFTIEGVKCLGTLLHSLKTVGGTLLLHSFCFLFLQQKKILRKVEKTNTKIDTQKKKNEWSWGLPNSRKPYNQVSAAAAASGTS